MDRGALLLLVLLVLPSGAGSPGEDILEDINRTCVPAAEMQLAGIRLGDPKALIESRLGASKAGTDVERATVLHYPGLRIRLHASRAQSILATSSEWSTPSGIRAGLSAARAGEILGFDLDSIESPHSRSPRAYHIHRCIESREQMDVEAYLRLGLSADRFVAEVEIFWVAP